MLVEANSPLCSYLQDIWTEGEALVMLSRQSSMATREQTCS